MVPAISTTVVADGLKRLTEAFKNKQNVVGINKALLGPFQELETLFGDLIAAIQNPTGDLLTRRARVVGEKRDGRSDAELLSAYLVRVLVNRSEGLAEDIIRIANAIWPSTYYEGGVADWIVQTSNIPSNPNTLASLLGEAKDGGAYGALSYSIWSPASDFVWTDTGGTVTTLGWTDDGGGYTGGLLYSLQVAQ